MTSTSPTRIVPEVGALQSGEEPQQRALAGAAGAEDCEEVAPLDFEIERAEDLDRPALPLVYHRQGRGPDVSKTRSFQRSERHAPLLAHLYHGRSMSRLISKSIGHSQGCRIVVVPWVAVLWSLLVTGILFGCNH